MAMYNNVTTKFKWGNMKDTAHQDPQSRSLSLTTLNMFTVLAENLYGQGKIEEARKVLVKWVLPFIESTRYSFIPLKEDKFRDKGNLDNTGSAPVNFLIDQKGRIVFSHFRIDEKDTDMLEPMIKEFNKAKF